MIDEPDDTEASSAPADGSSPPVAALPRRWQDRRRGMDPEHRRRVMDACALRRTDGWASHYMLMLVLSGLVAVMGLSADSAALVIGAMLLAPLMTPVLAVAASITMALGGPLRRAVVILAISTAGSILLAFVVALFLRDDPLGAEVLSRTSPDARDLVVALAAGTAGAYSLSRADISTSLPGVAIAVALLPPLGVVGITLEAGRTDLARGALLLYATNLAAMVVAGVGTFVITGFAPPRRLQMQSRRVLISTGVVAVLLLATAVPLIRASFRAAAEARDREAVERSVSSWLAASSDRIDAIEILDDVVDVRISGFDEPPPTLALEQEIGAILGGTPELVVRWTQTKPAVQEIPLLSAEELRDLDIAGVVRAWLADGTTGSADISRLDITDGAVRVDVVSALAPPGIADLERRLVAELGVGLELEVNWLPPTRIDDPGSIDFVAAELAAVAEQWAAELDNTAIGEVRYDGTTVEVDVVGVDRPDASALEAGLRAAAGADLRITVWFLPREYLVPAPTPVPTATEAPTPTVEITPTPDPQATAEPTPS